MPCPVEPTLISDPAANTEIINAILEDGGHVRIPKGEWSVLTITMRNNSRISGCGIGLSTLKLDDSSIDNWAQSVVIRTNNAKSIQISDLTIDGNHSNLDFSSVMASNLHRTGIGVLVEGSERAILSRVALKNCWKDGVRLVKTGGVIGPPGPPGPVQPASSATPTSSPAPAASGGPTPEPIESLPTHCILQNLLISDYGRYGISMNSGVDLVFDNIDIANVRPSTAIPPDPQAGIDATPVTGVTDQVKNIAMSSIRIQSGGQGILFRGDTPNQAIRNISINNVVCDQITGKQVLHFKRVEQFSVSNVVCESYDGSTQLIPNEDVGGFSFEDSVGTANNLTIKNVTYSTNLGGAPTPYPVNVFGDDGDVQMVNLRVENSTYGALCVGAKSGSPDASSLSLTGFTFRDLMGITGPQVIVANSSGDVKLVDGLIRETGNSAQTVNTQTDVYFEGCDFSPGNSGNIFLFSAVGKAIGTTNVWNRTPVGQNSGQFSVTRENVIAVGGTGNSVVIRDPALWDGNRITIHDVRPSFTGTIGVAFLGVPTEGPTSINVHKGGLFLQSDGVKWFLNRLDPA